MLYIWIGRGRSSFVIREGVVRRSYCVFVSSRSVISRSIIRNDIISWCIINWSIVIWDIVSSCYFI